MNKMVGLIKYIYIHPLLWAVIALAIVTAHFIELSLFLLIIFVHEMGHAVAASFFSWRIKRIALLPFGGVAEMEEHGNRPLKEELIVILSGPLQHLWMIGVAFFLYKFSFLSEGMYELFIQYNLMVLLFNLLPIWPLDGGKLIFLLLSLYHAFPEAHRRVLQVSAVSVILFACLILTFSPINLNIWVVLAFLLFSLYHEWKQSRYIFMRFLLERYYGKSGEVRHIKPIVVQEDEMVLHVLEKFQRGCKHPIIIEKDGKEKGSMDENELLHAYFTEKMVTSRIGDLLHLY
ncbi:stage IV sporulation protein FB [Cytobacillus depressus]|uniref:Stage IV sporulation protein FB n=1 Tax=Cytobacillus depressus TaxID=1602942 RepID=A0A6L3VDU5_9BACI|nr:M50 family metallopeptidase [Cytobacillus depressus]KAB2338707.1 stage IV sporulation protein FB [Cytobacillus depressus]